MTLSKNTYRSVVYYMMKGPQAVENRLIELENELHAYRARLFSLALLRNRLRSMGLGKLFLVAVACLRALGRSGRRTLKEIYAERTALSAMVGNTLRTWETKKAGPAPHI